MGTPKYFTQLEPTLLTGGPIQTPSKGGARIAASDKWISAWIWCVAGRQFVASFECPGGEVDEGLSAQARRDLMDYVQAVLPGPRSDSARVVGPCCVPEAGDIPRPSAACREETLDGG